MKTITLRQPWATLMARGYKKLETRSWATKHRGPLLIHASKQISKADLELCKIYPFNLFVGDPGKLPLGCIVGAVNVTDVHRTEDVVVSINGRERAFGDYSEGRYAWRCINAQEFADPIYTKGALSLWDYSGQLPDLKGDNS
ncbi:ASCH domain-containing protein [Hufsiella ginkgonis]|uniref:ASCH domain-containing protein n=1 Tax=Hufsiella ginkgonis TaxID=2695274 RepID=A0A7K1Y2E6_9SPHI|nr:ASCH domain-containing protein [Hufsiella ginkgonis]MXV16856.1 ASCH domain-containing protein [Hufsiella ginkgonis]